MADYKLYDTNNHSVLIDPITNEDKIYKQKQAAMLYAQQNRGYTVIKDSLSPELKSSIEKRLGKIEYSNEREADRGYYAIVKDHKGHYDSLEINKQDKGYQVKVKSGFPNHQQAYEHINRQQSITMEKLPKEIAKRSLTQELSR